MVLVGNKSDKKDERAVSTQDGKNYAKKFNNCVFLETSAKACINIDKIFEELVRQIWKRDGRPDDQEDKGRGICVLL